MADVAAPAPAASATPTPTNGATSHEAPTGGKPAPKPNGTPAPKPAPKAAAPTARANDGRFLPKDGNQSLPEPEGGEPPPAKEPYRFKTKLKVYGAEEDVDMSEEDIKRELQIARALQRKAKSFVEGQSKAQRLMELAERDPEAFLRETGKDPDEWALQRLASRAQLEAMTPEEKRAHEAESKLAQLEAQLKQREEAEKSQQSQALKARLIQENVATIKPALEKLGLDPNSYEALYLAVETKKLGLDAGIQYTPDELAQETGRRMDTFVNRYLGSAESPDGAALVKKLGPKRIAAIIQAEWRRKSAERETIPGVQDEPQAAEPVTQEAPRYLDASEIDRRLRAMTTKR